MGVLSSIGNETQISSARRALELRSSLENPNISLSDASAWARLFGSWTSAAGVDITPERILGIPSAWSAINFISGTFAALPAPVYKKIDGGREKDENNEIYLLLHDWVNDDYLTSFAWRKQSMVNTLLRGRSFTFIEGKRTGKITNLWPLNPDGVTVERVNSRRRYKYRDGGKEFIYGVDEIIDVPFMMMGDNINAVNPSSALKNAFGLAIALETYASKFFQNGGVPPLAMQMPAGTSGGAARRGIANIDELVKVANEEGRLVLPMPEGHRLEQIGFEPGKGQLTEARLMQVREVARIYMLPPVFLQDLEFGTFTNTEQQDLILVKHTLTQWLTCWEQELNAKLFGPRSKNYIKFNVDGLLRGDFKTRMEGIAKGIQNAVLTPNDGRALEERPRSTQPDANKLHIQGATVPLGEQTKVSDSKVSSTLPDSENQNTDQ